MIDTTSCWHQCAATCPHNVLTTTPAAAATATATAVSTGTPRHYHQTIHTLTNSCRTSECSVFRVRLKKDPSHELEYLCNESTFYYPRDALHSADIAVVACQAHAGIVSKRIKISSNFFLGLVALWFSNTTHVCEILTGMGACHLGGLRYFRSENA